MEYSVISLLFYFDMVNIKMLHCSSQIVSQRHHDVRRKASHRSTIVPTIKPKTCTKPWTNQWQKKWKCWPWYKRRWCSPCLWSRAKVRGRPSLAPLLPERNRVGEVEREKERSKLNSSLFIYSHFHRLWVSVEGLCVFWLVNCEQAVTVNRL